MDDQSRGDVLMRIHVKLFALLRERAGVSELEIDLHRDASLEDLRAVLSQRFPNLHDVLSKSAVAVNQTYATAGTRLAAEDEVALLPPVSGG